MTNTFVAMPKHKIIEDVLIVDTGFKGMSVGKTPDGFTVFVQGAVPGDRLHVFTLRRRKGAFVCVPHEFIEYSPLRTEPRCSHFGMCGGCKWQHMQYGAQLEFKEKFVRDALTRIAHIPEAPVAQIIGCSDPFYYRNKMEYTFTNQSWVSKEEHDTLDFRKRQGLGLHVAGAFAHVTNIQECFLQPEPANAIRNFIRDYALAHDLGFQNVRRHDGLLRNVILRNNTAGQFMVTLVFGAENADSRKQLFEALLSAFDCITSLYYCINTKPNDAVSDLEFVHVAGDPYLHMQLGHIAYRLGPKSFFQTNTLQAETMCRVVKEMTAPMPDMLLYDLYCGIGSFALFLAKDVRHVVGIEFLPEAIEDAKLNAQYNNIDNARFYAGDVRTLINAPDVLQYRRPDVVLTDPPRAGMDSKVVDGLVRINAPRIVYVSCNPATQARDLELLASHYHVTKSQPIDMFPHTAHVENVALLERRS